MLAKSFMMMVFVPVPVPVPDPVPESAATAVAAFLMTVIATLKIGAPRLIELLVSFSVSYC